MISNLIPLAPDNGGKRLPQRMKNIIYEITEKPLKLGQIINILS